MYFNWLIRINPNIKKTIPKNNLEFNVNLNVGRTDKATFREKISHGTNGVPLKAVIKWFIIPIKKVNIILVNNAGFIFPIKQ